MAKDGDLPDIPVLCVLQNPLRPQEVMIGTKIGVWATEDITQGSPTWVQTNNGMSEVPVTDLDYMSSGNKILATTYGRGMFTSQFTGTPLGIEDEVLANNDIRVYPTVGNGEINIKSNTDLGRTQVGIYAMTGQEVFNSEISLSNKPTELNLNLSTGMYLVKLKSQDRDVTKRIIIE